jgi:hypothetical protein
LVFFWLVFSLCFFIREIGASRGRCYGFPRNLALVSVLYIRERPEMIFSRRGITEGQNKKNQITQRNKNMKLKMQIALITLAVAASTSLAWSTTIEGVWQVSRQGVDCNDPNQLRGTPFPAIMTFHRDGTVTGAAKSPVTGPFDTPEYGLWEREPGSQNYSFREMNYRYDGNGTFIGSLVLTGDLDLTDANSFTYSATIQLFDPNGNLLTSLCGRGTGTRFE